MIHYARNSTVLVPVEVALFDSTGAARTGEASTTNVSVVCLENGYQLDAADGTFKTTPTTPTFPTTAFSAPFANYYQHRFDVSTWPRGHYVASIAAAGSEVYTQDFSVGLVVERKLGFTAVYTGTQLNLAVWVEENGVVQTDYTSLQACQILNAAGSVITGGTIGNIGSPVNGIFSISTTITLAAASTFIFDCKAQVAAPTGATTYQFPLRTGLARP